MNTLNSRMDLLKPGRYDMVALVVPQSRRGDLASILA